MTSVRFTRLWIGALCLLLLFKLLFPLILGPLVYSTGCRGTGGACGAMALVFSLLLPIPVILGAGLVLVFAAWRRGGTVGLPVSASLFVLLMYLGAVPMLLVGGSFWAAGFALGILAVPFPWTLGLLLAALVGLSCYPGPVYERRAIVARNLLGVLALVASVLTAPFWLQGLTLLPFVRRALFPVYLLSFRLLRPLAFLGLGTFIFWIVLLLFAGAVAYAVLTTRRAWSAMNTDG